MSWSAKDIARQITLIDHELFRKIRPKECLNQSWNKENREQKAPNIFAMINRFNLNSRWVSVQIVKEESLKKRIKVMEKIIEIADECQELHNYNAVFTIISGLGNASVHRLKKTWEGLSNKAKDTHERLSQLISRDKNFFNVRNEILVVSPPSIPYIGIYLTDLTFIEGGNPDLLNNMINFVKRRKLALVIRDLQTYQQTSYPQQPIPQLNQLLLDISEDDPLMKDDKALYDLSLRREERKQSNSANSPATPKPAATNKKTNLSAMLHSFGEGDDLEMVT